MEHRARADRLEPVVRPLVEKMGFEVVELRSGSARQALRVSLVIHKPGGVSLEDCSSVYRNVLPRIEVAENRRDVHLEVSSPGLSRELRSAEEFKVFAGSAVKVLSGGQAEWIEGTIAGSTEAAVVLEKAGKTTEHLYRDILKARLDPEPRGGEGR